MQIHSERHFWLSVARGCGGAIIFSFPLLMTTEMWWLGFTMEPARLLLLVAVTTPLLALVSYYSGFDRHHNLLESVLDEQKQERRRTFNVQRSTFNVQVQSQKGGGQKDEAKQIGEECEEWEE